MAKIICPNCHQEFEIDDESYTDIINQVSSQAINDEVERRLHEAAEASDSKLKAKLSEKENEFKDKMADLKEKLSKDASDVKDKLTEEIDAKKSEIVEKEKKIAELEAQINEAAKSKKTEQELAVKQALEDKEKELADKANEITKLKGQLEINKEKAKSEKKNLEDSYKGQLKLKDEEIERVKEYKAQLSTKGIGEDLEKYCHNEFDKVRAMAFPNAYFEKDNDAKDGTKGDFIFRDYVDDTEYVSIMFEMKNEADTTATKQKNEDFFKKLDEDRTKKNCEYAVLVSMLEQDNDFYNQGIADVSHKHEKMYVIRPQFFVQFIGLIRNAAKAAVDYKKELAVVKNQNADLTNFEENIEEFKRKFGRNYELASKQFKDAVDNIDKSIKDLENTKAKLLSSINNIRLANDKAQEDLTVKRLTKNAPSVVATLEKIREEKED